MATSSHAARNIAIVSTSALLLWLWFNGRGSGKGLGRGKSDGDAGHATAHDIVTVLSEDRLKLNGTPADLQTVIAHGRSVGAALVCIAGNARAGWGRQVRQELAAAGVSILMPSGADWEWGWDPTVGPP